MPVSPALRQIITKHIENDDKFESKKDLLNMMYCQHLLLSKCDKVLLMKIYYYVNHSKSPLKAKCLELLNAHFKRNKLKIRRVNLDTIQREIRLNLNIEDEQRHELLNDKQQDNDSNKEEDEEEKLESGNASEKPLQVTKTDRQELLKEDDMDIEALEELKNELEQLVVTQMKGMGSDIKSSSLRFNQVLQKDNTTILDTSTLMAMNENNLTAEQKKLKQVHSDTWRTTCYTLLLFIVVVICFIGTYMVIRTFPNSNKPKLTSFVGNIVATFVSSLWSIIFPAQEANVQNEITLTNEEL